MSGAIDAAALAKVYRLEAELLALPQVDLPVTHDFLPGLYIRTMRIPAGTVATGAVHRNEDVFFVQAGDITVLTADGPVRLQAGAMVKGAAGCKRAVVAHADTVLTTVHANPTDERDPLKLWDLYTSPCPLGADMPALLGDGQ